MSTSREVGTGQVQPLAIKVEVLRPPRRRRRRRSRIPESRYETSFMVETSHQEIPKEQIERRSKVVSPNPLAKCSKWLCFLQNWAFFLTMWQFQSDSHVGVDKISEESKKDGSGCTFSALSVCVNFGLCGMLFSILKMATFISHNSKKQKNTN